MTKPIHLTTAELAARWRRSETSLRMWRMRGLGPRYIKLGGPQGRALYRLSDIIAYEKKGKKT